MEQETGINALILLQSSIEESELKQRLFDFPGLIRVTIVHRGI